MSIISNAHEQRPTKAEKQHSIEQYLAETQGDDSNQVAAPQPSGEGDVRVHSSAVPMASNMLAQDKQCAECVANSKGKYAQVKTVFVRAIHLSKCGFWCALMEKLKLLIYRINGI